VRSPGFALSFSGYRPRVPYPVSGHGTQNSSRVRFVPCPVSGHGLKTGVRIHRIPCPVSLEEAPKSCRIPYPLVFVSLVSSVPYPSYPVSKNASRVRDFSKFCISAITQNEKSRGRFWLGFLYTVELCRHRFLLGCRYRALVVWLFEAKCKQLVPTCREVDSQKQLRCALRYAKLTVMRFLLA